MENEISKFCLCKNYNSKLQTMNEEKHMHEGKVFGFTFRI